MTILYYLALGLIAEKLIRDIGCWQKQSGFLKDGLAWLVLWTVWLPLALAATLI